MLPQNSNWDIFYSEVLGLVSQPQTLYTRSGPSLTLNPLGTPMFDQSIIPTYNVYFNSVYINASSSGANFGTSGVFHTNNATATTAKLDLRDNIIDNVSTPNGTGLTVCHRRSAPTAFPAN